MNRFAEKYVESGLAILPICLDGSKKPACESWDPENAEEFSPSDIGGLGIGIKCGQVSQNLVVFDFEDEQVFHDWRAFLRKCGIEVHDEQPLVASPRPGYHLYVSLDSVPPAGEKLAKSKDGKTLIETRGSGHYVLAPGSPPECHPSNEEYYLCQGDLDHIPVISQIEFDVMRQVAKEISPMKMEGKKIVPSNSGKALDASLPGGDFNLNGPSWDDILAPHGFIHCKTRHDGADLYQKPNSSNKGAHLILNDPGPMTCFSTSCPPFNADQDYSKFSAYALLNHNGDFIACARALKEMGYGQRGAIAHCNGAARPLAPNTVASFASSTLTEQGRV